MRTPVIMLAAIMACTVAGSPVAPVASELDARAPQNDVDGYAGRSGWYYTKIVDEVEDTKVKERAPQNDVDGYAGRSGWYYTKIADGAAEDSKVEARAPQNVVDGYAGRSGWYYTKKVEEDA